MKISNITSAVTAFISTRSKAKSKTFHMEDLSSFVTKKLGGAFAPGSPDRIARNLRSAGVVDYELFDRASSTYLAVR